MTTIANGSTHGGSTDVLIRVLAATGHRAEVRVKKAAAYSDNLPMGGRDDHTVIPLEWIEEVLRGNFQPGQPHRLNGMNGS